MKAIVYVDGFNLYYGALKRTPYKWLNIMTLCNFLLPKNRIVGIKYFTALVTARPNDPTNPPGSRSICAHCEPFPISKSYTGISSNM